MNGHGHDFGHGLEQSHDFGRGHDFGHGHVRKPRTRTNFGHACPLISGSDRSFDTGESWSVMQCYNSVPV